MAVYGLLYISLGLILFFCRHLFIIYIYHLYLLLLLLFVVITFTPQIAASNTLYVYTKFFSYNIYKLINEIKNHIHIMIYNSIY